MVPIAEFGFVLVQFLLCLFFYPFLESFRIGVRDRQGSSALVAQGFQQGEMSVAEVAVTELLQGCAELIQVVVHGSVVCRSVPSTPLFVRRRGRETALGSAWAKGQADCTVVMDINKIRMADPFALLDFTRRGYCSQLQVASGRAALDPLRGGIVSIEEPVEKASRVFESDPEYEREAGDEHGETNSVVGEASIAMGLTEEGDPGNGGETHHDDTDEGDDGVEPEGD